MTKLHLTLHIKKKLFPKAKRYLPCDWCFTGSWIPLSKTLLTQTITNYQNHSQNYSHKHFKIDSEPGSFVRRWASKGRGAYSTAQWFRRESSRGVYLKYSSLLCKNYRSLNYSLTKSSFYIMVFNEKICKIKVFDAYSTLESCGVSR